MIRSRAQQLCEINLCARYTLRLNLDWCSTLLIVEGKKDQDIKYETFRRDPLDSIVYSSLSSSVLYVGPIFGQVDRSIVQDDCSD